MKYMIIGLGNIGGEYTLTRHNIGFLILDYLAEQHKVIFQREKLADVALIKYKGRSFYLIKPLTYMNLSGKAVRFWQQKLAISQEKSLVVTDDIHLSWGKLRLRLKGSSGGHNGIAHIETMLGNQQFPRLRFGIGKNFGHGEQASYVLSKFTQQEKSTLNAFIKRASQAIEDFCTQPVSLVMNKYNQ